MVSIYPHLLMVNIMDLFEEPINNLEYHILFLGIWEIACDTHPKYYVKHSAADAWRYRNVPASSPEVWCPDFDTE